MVGLAKLTPPSATGLLPRERLFARLDAAFQQRLAWIAAPAGSGKTSLAASWLAARGPAPVWYRVDADDADPANFFHYLALAAGDPGADLPALTPEYLPGLATFARRFFRALFAALPTPFVLVLDNYQEVPAASPLHGLVDILAEELPVGGGLLAISRLGPPPALARACARGMVLDYGDLRFTPAETADLFRLLGLSDADRVHAASDGWAVGIVLTARGSGSGFAGAGQSRQALFDFIAAEFFDPLPAERREFLLRVGVLPVVTEGLCVALTGDSRGLAWLDELRREHLFITVQARGERAYEFHPLLRAFLAQRLASELDADERVGAWRRGAMALERAGMIESAVEAWAQAGDWGELGRLVCAQAPAALATGRHAMVLGWLEQIPAPAREASPWLAFWAAACRMMSDPAAARGDFERAYAAFRAAADLPGQWLCWAGIAETFLFGWDSLAGLDPWIDELDVLLARQREFPSPDIEARVLPGAVALAFRRPDHPLLPVWAERALNLIRGRRALAQTAMLAHFAGVYHMWRGHTRMMDAVLEAVRVVDAPMTPLGHLMMAMLDLVSANFQGDAARVEAAFARAMALAGEHGVHVLDVPLIQNAGLAALARGDADRLDALIRMARPGLLPGRWMEASAQIYLEAGLALLRGDPRVARDQADKTYSLVVMGGVPYWVIHNRLFTAHLEILDGKAAAVRGELDAIVAETRHIGCDLLLAAALLTLARARQDAGERQAALESLREGLAIGARWNYGHLFLYAAPDVEGRICALALEEDIEPRYVRRLVRQRAPRPPADAGERWPWPVRIFTLGGFRVVLGEEALRFTGKPQKKPLELLKALVAQGEARPPAHSLAQLLWPDAEGSALKKTLEITLHRLRKLLGGDDAVLLREGRLVLNPERCWIDVWAFEHLVDRALDALRAPIPDPAGIERDAGHALRLYAGAFLAAEEESSWLLPARDRARSRFHRLVADYGGFIERAGLWDAAADLYRRGLEQDNLNEFLYRRLIHCLQRRDRHAEALGVYRRCRELLSIVLGVAPSAETEALIRSSRDT
ncbi:MAG: hypothetical protein KBF24_04855 [Thiobacillaceae bacterium]|jgi:LuxR family maltose regulon positive regulatory protein|nr:hypothetical protein [Thiobacillaceae bacterium]